jgi:hypothetical protein
MKATARPLVRERLGGLLPVKKSAALRLMASRRGNVHQGFRDRMAGWCPLLKITPIA